MLVPMGTLHRLDVANVGKNQVTIKCKNLPKDTVYVVQPSKCDTTKQTGWFCSYWMVKEATGDGTMTKQVLKQGSLEIPCCQEGADWHPLALGTFARSWYILCRLWFQKKEEVVYILSLQSVRMMLEGDIGKRQKTKTSCSEQPSLCRLSIAPSLCTLQCVASISFCFWWGSQGRNSCLMPMIFFLRVCSQLAQEACRCLR